MSKPDLSAIAELVPQVSYDIIGRIIPGIMVIVSLVIAVLGPAQALGHLDEFIIHPDPPVSGWAVVLLLIVAYLGSHSGWNLAHSGTPYRIRGRPHPERPGDGGGGLCGPARDEREVG